MTDLGELSFFLGMEFVKLKVGMVMYQQKYIGELLDKFEMKDCNSVSNPSETNSKLDECSEEEKVDSTMFRQIVGSLRYLCNSRPNICYSVSVISKFMHDPRKPHLIATKRILRYVKGTMKYGLLFPYGAKSEVNELIGYSDSDWCGDLTDRKALLAMYSNSMMLQFHGALRSNQSLHSHHVKQNTLQEHLLRVKHYG